MSDAGSAARWLARSEGRASALGLDPQGGAAAAAGRGGVARSGLSVLEGAGEGRARGKGRESLRRRN